MPALSLSTLYSLLSTFTDQTLPHLISDFSALTYLLVFLGGLWMGGWIFSDRLLGKLLGGGITTVFLILGPVLTGEAAAGQELLIRLGLIMGAVVYVVLAFGLLERLTRGRRLNA